MKIVIEFNYPDIMIDSESAEIALMNLLSDLKDSNIEFDNWRFEEDNNEIG